MDTPEHKRTVLVVEDDAQLRSALHDKLSHDGLDVLEAADGQEGLEVALRERPHLILLDLVMPNMDGFEMAKKLRADAWGAKVPVVILSNLTDMKSVQEALSSDIYEFFVKTDVKIDEVIERVKQLLRLA